MNISQTLKFFRTKKKFKQGQAKPKTMDQSAYSRIEQNTRPISTDELSEILDNISVTPSEFFSFAEYNKKQTDFKNLFFSYASDLENDSLKQELLAYYKLFKADKHVNLRYLANYTTIVLYFKDKLKEVSPLTKKDLELVYTTLNKKKFYSFYDYQILANSIVSLHPAIAESILTQMIPIDYENQRDSATFVQAQGAISNIISVCIYSNMNKRARRYITIAKQLETPDNPNQARIDIYYLENLLNYLETGENQYLNRIEQYKDMLKEIGATEHLKNVEEEIRLLTFEKQPQKLLHKFGIGLYKSSKSDSE
ncbi:hypothetical protein A5819_003478 [Enterococcus sp. 7E2_DIV0204]|uniref:hypothetical protein n=1 Tax=unclassified Enterococcus TaxID=2608891 RepID=UPI000A34F97A|nr:MULTISPECIES: hypothetical protein [unclassified Enterococcus]OTN83928.1 hypothetical protein A5819_003478 [Enterococcus sp. 7E2_DIV0204]OTP46836.1 hypothetical protein A5884_003714 [Enterococcus sp. 7D2_DIV0200]